MRLKTTLLGLAGASLMATTPAQAVDLVGAYQDALDFDPVLQAAEFRREATQENRKIARANLLPQLGASGRWNWGTSETAVPGLELDDSDIETNNYSIDLRQSLYRQANSLRPTPCTSPPTWISCSACRNVTSWCSRGSTA